MSTEKLDEIRKLKERIAELESTDEFVEVSEEENIIEADFTEEKPEDDKLEMETLIYLGQSKNGELVFTVTGNKNLLLIDGLLEYAKREMTRVWNEQARLVQEEKEFE